MSEADGIIIPAEWLTTSFPHELQEKIGAAALKMLKLNSLKIWAIWGNACSRSALCAGCWPPIPFSLSLRQTPRTLLPHTSVRTN
jgi:hypothetical protein